MASRSIVEYFAEHEKYRCGYCGSSDTNYSHGMWAHVLTVQDYQDLVDRGWRRSGKYVYKPSMNVTCCPQYPVRQAALKFQISKSQKKIIKQFNRYISQDIRRSQTECGTSTEQLPHAEEDHEAVSDYVECKAARMQELRDPKVEDTCKHSDASSGASSMGKDTSKSGSVGLTKNVLKAVDNKGVRADMETGTLNTACTDSKGRKDPQPGVGADPNKPPCKKAKVLRMERRQRKLADKGMQQESSGAKCQKGNEPKSVEEFLDDIANKPRHQLEIKLVRSSPRSREFEDSFEESYNVYKKYQMVIHKDPPDKPSEKQYTRFLVDSPLEIKLVRSGPRSEEFEQSFKESFEVYHKYQMAIHKDPPEDCDEEGFVRFLVDSPLQPMHHEGGYSEGFGSFHQQYWLDGKIIAVGVLDILPNCVSSVYLYYDPDYGFLSPGTYSALREIAFTRFLHSQEPNIEYYYMGFYIHSCPKMRYKGQYYPSFLLCPEVYTWHSMDDCRPKLDANKYSRFAPPEDKDSNGEIELQSVLVLHTRQAMPYIIYCALNHSEDDHEEVLQYAGFVGRTCAERMLLYRA